MGNKRSKGSRLYTRPAAVILSSALAAAAVIIAVKLPGRESQDNSRNENEIITGITEQPVDTDYSKSPDNREGTEAESEAGTQAETEAGAETGTDTKETTGYGGNEEAETGGSGASDELKKARYTYDALGRVESVEYEHYLVKYEYDKNGNILSIKTINK